MASYLLNLIFISAIALVVAFWWKTQGVKQLAFTIAKRRCDEVGVQLLDQSIMLKRLRLRRGRSGGLSVVRFFVFEFSASGAERYRGEVEMLGQHLARVEMEAYRF